MTKQAKPMGLEAKQYCDASEALTLAKEKGIDITLATLLTWVDKHKLGFQPNGNNSKWFIHRENFMIFLSQKLVP